MRNGILRRYHQRLLQINIEHEDAIKHKEEIIRICLNLSNIYESRTIMSIRNRSLTKFKHGPETKVSGLFLILIKLLVVWILFSFMYLVKEQKNHMYKTSNQVIPKWRIYGFYI